MPPAILASICFGLLIAIAVLVFHIVKDAPAPPSPQDIVRAFAFQPGQTYLILCDEAWISQSMTSAIGSALHGLGVDVLAVSGANIHALRVVGLDPLLIDDLKEALERA